MAIFCGRFFILPRTLQAKINETSTKLESLSETFIYKRYSLRIFVRDVTTESSDYSFPVTIFVWRCVANRRRLGVYELQRGKYQDSTLVFYRDRVVYVWHKGQRISHRRMAEFGWFLEGSKREETVVNYTDPEALCSGNMAGISPEAESIPTLPRRNRCLACSGNRRQNRASFLQCS